jgi:hypothetical protein
MLTDASSRVEIDTLRLQNRSFRKGWFIFLHFVWQKFGYLDFYCYLCSERKKVDLVMAKAPSFMIVYIQMLKVLNNLDMSKKVRIFAVSK